MLIRYWCCSESPVVQRAGILWSQAVFWLKKKKNNAEKPTCMLRKAPEEGRAGCGLSWEGLLSVLLKDHCSRSRLTCSGGYLNTRIFSSLLHRANTLLSHPGVMGICQVAPWTLSRTGVDKLVKELGLPEEIYQIYLISTNQTEICKNTFRERPGSEEEQSLVWLEHHQ